MNDIIASQLHHLDLLLLQGPDAIKFLQGQCTQDVSQLKIGQPTHGAFCTAKGRAITNVRMVKINNDQPTIALLCHQSSAALLHKHLNKYLAFFRGTQLTHQPGQYSGYCLEASTLPNEVDLNFDETGYFFCQWSETSQLLWVHNDTAPIAQIQASLKLSFAKATQWQLECIKNKQLWLDEQQVEQWVPQNFSLDELDGISFKKGCYTGQEVIARLHYKGQSKKRLYAFRSTGHLEKISHIFAQGKNVGDVIEQIQDGNDTFGLVILKTQAIEDTLYGDENQQVNIELLH